MNNQLLKRITGLWIALIFLLASSMILGAASKASAQGNGGNFGGGPVTKDTGNGGNLGGGEATTEEDQSLVGKQKAAAPTEAAVTAPTTESQAATTGENIGAPATETPGALGEGFNSPDQAVIPEAGADGEQLGANPKTSENLGDTSQFAPQEGQTLEGDQAAGNGGNFGGGQAQESEVATTATQSELEEIPIGRLPGEQTETPPTGTPTDGDQGIASSENIGAPATEDPGALGEGFNSPDQAVIPEAGADGEQGQANQVGEQATADQTQEQAATNDNTIIVTPETMKEVYAEVAKLVKEDPELGKEVLGAISEDIKFVVQADPGTQGATKTTPAVDLTTEEGKTQALQKVEQFQQQLTTAAGGASALSSELTQRMELIKTAIQSGDQSQMMNLMQDFQQNMQNFIPPEAMQAMSEGGARMGDMAGGHGPEFFRDFMGGPQGDEGFTIDPRTAIECIQREVMLSAAEEHLKGMQDTNPEAYQRGMEQLVHAREQAFQLAETSWMPTAFEGPWGQNENGTWGPMEPGTGGVPAAHDGPWGQNEQGVWGPMDPQTGPVPALHEGAWNGPSGAGGSEGPWTGGHEMGMASRDDFMKSFAEIFRGPEGAEYQPGAPGEWEHQGPTTGEFAGPITGEHYGPAPQETEYANYVPREFMAPEFFREYTTPETTVREYEHYANDPLVHETYINETLNEARQENTVNNTSYNNYTPPPAPEPVLHHHDLGEAVHAPGDQHACVAPQCN